MKNVIFWVGVKNKHYSKKYGGCEWMDISRKNWEYWCEKHDVIFQKNNNVQLRQVGAQDFLGMKFSAEVTIDLFEFTVL